MRLLTTIEIDLEPQFARWETLSDPMDDEFVQIMLNWAWQHGDLTAAIRQSYRLEDNANVDVVQASFFTAVRRWLFGDTYAQIAIASGQEIDDILAIQTAAISFGLQTVIEQALSLLSKLIESRGGQIAPSVAIFSELLRFGVPNQTASLLCSSGVRHRRAAILLAELGEIQGVALLGRTFMFAIASQVLRNNEAIWLDRLGSLVYANTLADVS
jgi:hypothetical protein